MKGYEAGVALGGLLLHGGLAAGLPLYATVISAAAGISLMRGRVSRGMMLFALTAPFAALASASAPIQIGYAVWAFAVTALSIGTVVMYFAGDDDFGG
ncbi:MAG TPA: hypothetical protein VGF28_05335 [Thermoanaerobaculia bacterium]|jgi:hypothetical protein